MTYGGMFRSLAACGLAAAVWLACGATAHGQAMRTSGGSSGGGSSGFGGGSSGFGGGGGSGGGSSLGSSNGFGNGGNGTFSFAGGSSFAGSSGSTFAGGSGSGGSSFAGSSGGSSFTGGSTFSGSSGTGGYSMGGGGLRGGSSQGVSSMNQFRSTFGNVLGSGLGTSTAFGQALYSNLSPTATNLIGSGSSGVGGAGMRGGMGGGIGGMGSTGSTANASGGSLGALGIVNGNSAVVPLPSGPGPAAPGVAALNPLANPAVRLSALPARMQEDLQGLVARSDVSPTTRTAVTFGVDAGGTLVLRGAAANAADARTIENLVRFAPGVRGVRNEMTWR